MEHLAPLITALGTALGGGVVGVLLQRRLARKDLAAAADAHLKTFYDTLNAQMKAQEERHTGAIKQLQDEQREERKQWADERRAFNLKIDHLSSALQSKEIEVVELKGQVNLLTDRLGRYEQGSAA